MEREKLQERLARERRRLQQERLQRNLLAQNEQLRREISHFSSQGDRPTTPARLEVGESLAPARGTTTVRIKREADSPASGAGGAVTKRRVTKDHVLFCYGSQDQFKRSFVRQDVTALIATLRALNIRTFRSPLRTAGTAHGWLVSHKWK